MSNAASRSHSTATSSTTGKSQTAYGGVVAVAVTPCCEEGVVDPPAMRRLCEEYSRSGCDGVLVAGSTGESSLLDETDRRALTRAACQAKGPETRIYVGVTALGLGQTIRYACNAAEDGADVAVVTAPYFFKFTQSEVTAFMTAVADKSPLPIALYHHPRVPTPLSRQTIAAMAEHPNVVAVKYTNRNLKEMQAVLEAVGSREIVVMPGSERLLGECYAAGATGGMVTALAGVVPEWHVSLYRALRTGDTKTAETMQNRIVRLWEMFQFPSVCSSISSFSYSLKAALQRRGWLERLDALMPGFTPSEQLKQDVARHLDAAGAPTATSRRKTDDQLLRSDPPSVASPAPHTDRV